MENILIILENKTEKNSRLISEFSSSLNPPEGSSIELLSTFVQTLPDETKVDIAVIVPTELSSNLSDTLVIQNTSPQSSTLVEAVHIDATGVVDASIELNNIEFASISGDVRVIGGLGKNFVAADSGNQYIKLGKDDDTIYGGGGDDTVGSAGGIDRIFGDLGDDLVFGGRGADILSGGIGNDILKGGRGNDRVDGDDGLDSIRGGPGNDQIYGGAESDILWGNRGDDELIGNAFNDTIYGGSGSDEINGGRGVDTSIFKGNRSSYTINNKGNYFEVVKTKGQYAGEVDRLNNIEFMQFKDSVAPLHKNYFMYSLIEVDGSIDLLADSDGNLFASNEKTRDPIACFENAVPISKSSGEWDVIAAEIYDGNNFIAFGNSSSDLLVYEMDDQWNKISEIKSIRS